MLNLFRALIIVIATAMAMNTAFAVTGTVTSGKIDPLPIAITPFIASAGAENDAATISGVIANDLARSGYFKPLSPESFIEKITSFDQAPNFSSWSQAKAQALVVGTVTATGDKVTVAFKLYDVNTQAFLGGSSFTAPSKLSRRLAHKVADQVYNKITGFAPYFDTRIVYIDESGPKNARVKRLAMMDQDGFNARVLSNGKELLLTPRFSPICDVRYWQLRSFDWIHPGSELPQPDIRANRGRPPLIDHRVARRAMSSAFSARGWTSGRYGAGRRDHGQPHG